MEEITKTILLEYEKSTFNIDLIRRNSGSQYVKIRQLISDKEELKELNINFSALTDILFVLQSYHREISKLHFPFSNNKSYFSEEKQASVVRRYLKGVPIADLTLQFDCSIEIIEQILLNREIYIIEYDSPPSKKPKHNQKKKK